MQLLPGAQVVIKIKRGKLRFNNILVRSYHILSKSENTILQNFISLTKYWTQLNNVSQTSRNSSMFELYMFLNHTGQCKRTGGCYNELVVAFSAQMVA